MSDDPFHDDYAVWAALLRGDQPEIQARVPYCGHWKYRDRQGRVVPVSVWRGPDGAIVGRVGVAGISVTTDEWWCERVMAYAIKAPISQEEYDYFARHGRWSDDAPAPAVSTTNLPADPFEAFKLEAEEEFMNLSRMLAKGDEMDDERARVLTNWKNRFHGLENVGELMRKEEKKPHDDAARSVQAKFMPILDKIRSAKRVIDKELTPYLMAQQEKIIAATMDLPAYAMPADMPKARIHGNMRNVSLTTRWRAEVFDYELALEACKNTNEVRTAVELVANRAARSKDKIPMPGVEFIEDKSAR